MSLLERLLARGSGELTAVQPRLPGRFESPHTGVEEIHARETPETAEPAPSAAVSERPARPRPEPVENPRQEPPPTLEIRERRIVEKPVPPEISVLGDAPSLPPRLPSVPPPRETPEPRAASSEPPTPPRAPEPPALAAEPFERPAAAPPPVVLGPEPPSLGPVRPVSPVTASSMTGAKNGELRPAAPVITPPAPAGPPRVDVRIGHIEVRAIQPPAKTAPRTASAPRRSPKVSLDDYLRRRRSG